MGVVGCVCVMRVALFSMLVVMSSCLDESRSCSGVGLGGRFVSEVEIVACHLVAMGAARGSEGEELCVRFLRRSGDFACKSLWT